MTTSVPTLNLAAIRQRAEEAQERAGDWYVDGGDIRNDSEALADDVLSLCEEVERLQAERDHWRANHDNMVERNDFLRSRLDLPVVMVHERNHRLAILDKLDAAEAELKLRTTEGKLDE